MITIMKTGPHIFMVVFICSKNWVLGARWKQLSSSDIHKMETDHNWHKNTSWILLNPAEIESFLKTGADLTVSVLSHVCGSRFREITLCALKASMLSQALTQWPLDRLCFCLVKWRDIDEWDEKVLTQLTFSSKLPQSFSVILRLSALYLRISALRLPTVPNAARRISC